MISKTQNSHAERQVPKQQNAPSPWRSWGLFGGGASRRRVVARRNQNLPSVVRGDAQGGGHDSQDVVTLVPNGALVAQSARLSLERSARRSQFFDAQKEASLPRFDFSELVEGRLLHKGLHTLTHEVEAFHLQRRTTIFLDDDDEDEDDETAESEESEVKKMKLQAKEEQRAALEKAEFRRKFVAAHCRVETSSAALCASNLMNLSGNGKTSSIGVGGSSSGESRYAVKFINADVMENGPVDVYRRAACDLAAEAQLLASIQHPHIVQLRGLPTGDTRAFATGEYFVLMDRIAESLEQRLCKWRFQFRHVCGGRNEATADRLQVALDVANALQHLHMRNVIHRDLTPRTIGFHHATSSGSGGRGEGITTKIFHFGLARELDEANRLLPFATYDLRGNVGTIPYMAPENANGQPYGLSADVYNFAVLLWEIVCLRSPFESSIRDEEEFYERVVLENERPDMSVVSSCLSIELQSLMSQAFATSESERPPIHEFCQVLETEIESITLKCSSLSSVCYPHNMNLPPR